MRNSQKTSQASAGGVMLSRLINSWVRILIAIAILGFAFGLSSCNKKTNESSNAARVARGFGVSPIPESVHSFQPGGQESVYLGSTGRIFVSSEYSSKFTEAMRALVSATMTPESLGEVEIDKVFLRAYVEIDSAGKVIASSSRVEIEIHDEFTGQKDEEGEIPPVIIRVQALEGQARNGRAEITFRDTYGTLQFKGNYEIPTQANLNSATFRGEFRFQNNNGRFGDGLSFEIATCGFFRC
jgi:hypothetical protein